MSTNNQGPVIETQGLSKKIPVQGDNELIILKDISLSIMPGESVAITGASGSGKTTLLGLLAGLDLPSSGEIRLLEHPLHQLDEDGRASLRLGAVGFVFQSFHLMENLSALENVMIPLELEQQNSRIMNEAMLALERVGLGDRADHLPARLSGGEQQRVALARAFVTKPSILFADEPTGNLDRQTGNEIIELLFGLQQESGTTLVLITHDEHLADRCQTHYRLDNGKLTRQ
jgi:putative ABC transport system ATP-binding protein